MTNMKFAYLFLKLNGVGAIFKLFRFSIILSVGVTAYTIATIPRSMRDTTIDGGQRGKSTDGTAAMKESELFRSRGA